MNLKPFIPSNLSTSTTAIPFQPAEGWREYGYLAELLSQVCTVYLDARDYSDWKGSLA